MNVIQSNTQIGQCSVLQNLREQPCIAAIKLLRPLRIVSVARCIIEESEWGVSEVFGPHKKRRQVLHPSPLPPSSHTQCPEIKIQKQHILIIRYPSKIWLFWAYLEQASYSNFLLLFCGLVLIVVMVMMMPFHYILYLLYLYLYIYFILKNNMRDDGDDNDGVFLIPYQETAAIRQSC